METSPVKQKLDLYGFAILEICDCPINLKPWTRGRCFLGPGFSRKLAPLFPNCPTWENADPPPGVLIHHHVAFLKRIRQHWPHMPLILTQPLFHTTPKISSLLKSSTSRIPIPGLSPDDPFQPLRWSWPLSGTLPEFKIGYSDHPKVKFLKKLGLPEQTIWADEGGHLVIQENTSHKPPQVPDTLSVSHQDFLSKLGPLAGQFLIPNTCWAVCASRAQLLTWFQTDLFRLFPGRTWWINRDQPQISTRVLTQFRMLRDSDIKWGIRAGGNDGPLNGIIHLDHFSRRRVFRFYRIAVSKKTCLSGSWLSLKPTLGFANLQVGRHRFTLQKEPRGWFLATTSDPGPQNLTPEFYRRYRALEGFNGT